MGTIFEIIPPSCSFSWEKIREMKETGTEFWAGDGLNRLRIVEAIERDRTIYMMNQAGKKTWPVRFEKLEEVHARIHKGEVSLMAYEIDKLIPTWGNYIMGFFKFLGCEQV